VVTENTSLPGEPEVVAVQTSCWACCLQPLALGVVVIVVALTPDTGLPLTDARSTVSDCVLDEIYCAGLPAIVTVTSTLTRCTGGGWEPPPELMTEPLGVPGAPLHAAMLNAKSAGRTARTLDCKNVTYGYVPLRISEVETSACPLLPRMTGSCERFLG
jgi:hypothetical protein